MEYEKNLNDPTKKEAEKSFDTFLKTYDVKYPETAGRLARIFHDRSSGVRH